MSQLPSERINGYILIQSYIKNNNKPSVSDANDVRREIDDLHRRVEELRNRQNNVEHNYVLRDARIMELIDGNRRNEVTAPQLDKNLAEDKARCSDHRFLIKTGVCIYCGVEIEKLKQADGLADVLASNLGSFKCPTEDGRYLDFDRQSEAAKKWMLARVEKIINDCSWYDKKEFIRQLKERL